MPPHTFQLGGMGGQERALGPSEHAPLPPRAHIVCQDDQMHYVHRQWSSNSQSDRLGSSLV